jgi:hypothetical protein
MDSHIITEFGEKGKRSEAILLFSAAHLPQQIIGLGHPWPLALAFTVLTPANGLIAGYLWWKTRSLPLLVLLRLFAYARIGM